MSEELQAEVTEILSAVKDAQSKSKFNLADVIKGLGFPEESAEVYLDVASAYELSKLNDELIKTVTPEESKAIEERIEVLKEKIVSSKLIFKMRGIDQKQVEALEHSAQAKHGIESDEWALEYMCALVAANIVSVEDANGDVDEKLFTTEDAQALRGSLSRESWDVLVSTMQKLTLASGYFKGLTDAGFLPRS